MPKLICITGIDGVGKSTLVELLAEKIPTAYISNIWDIMEGGVETVPFKSKQDIDNYLCELSPDVRLLFLAHALKFSVDKALDSGSDLVILNGYYYKYFASELALNASADLVDSLMGAFPKPDYVFQLELSIEEIVNRKPHFSRYESGLSMQPGKDNFVEFQKKALEEWKVFDSANWVHLSTEDSPETLLTSLLSKIDLS